jgi:hypothetical protein
MTSIKLRFHLRLESEPVAHFIVQGLRVPADSAMS